MTIDIEPRLRDLVHSTGELIQPPIDLVDRGIERGRRLRGRHRARRAMATATAVAVIAAASGIVLRASDRRSGESVYGGRTITGISTPLNLPRSGGDATVPIDGRSAAVILLSLLPHGMAWDHGGQDDPGIPSPGSPAVYAYTTYDDGNGPVQVGVNFDNGWCLTWSCAAEFVAENDKPAESESARREAIASKIFSCSSMSGPCEQRDLADGSRLLVFDPYREHDGLNQGVQLVHRDGSRVEVFQTSAIADYASGNGKTFPASRDGLPLTTEQLMMIAASPLWQDEVPDSVLAAGLALNSFNQLKSGIVGGN